MSKLKFAIILLVAVGCASYSRRMEMSRDLYYDGDYEKALSGLNELLDDTSDKDLYLFLLERGKVNLAFGEYDSAIVDLSAAEARFQEIEATISIGDFVKSSLLNPGVGEYQPPSHEKILISSYLLLAYWFKGDMEGAFVERNRIVTRLNQYLGEEDSRQLEVPFARYLTAFLYEMEGMEDDARIEYEAIGKIRPEAVPPSVNSRLTELALFAEIGRSPVKISKEIRGFLQKRDGQLVGMFTIPGADGPLVFGSGVNRDFPIDESGVFITFAYPECVRQGRVVDHCKLVLDGIEAGKAVPLDVIEETAFAAYRKSLGRTLLHSAFRAYLKTAAQTGLEKKAGLGVDVLGKVLSLADMADTRSWQTLPAEIHVFRMEVDPGRHEAYVRYYGGDGQPLGVSRKVEFSIGKGEKRIVYLPGPT